MDSLPLRNLQRSGSDLMSTAFSTTANHHYARVPGAEGPQFPTDVPSPSLGSASTEAGQSGSFIPLTDEELSRYPGLKKPNYRPSILKPKALVPIAIWYILCFSGAAALAVLSQTQPSWFHLESQYSYNIWTYSPAIIGTLSTIILRGVTRAYIHIIPYVRMANAPLSLANYGSSSESSSRSAHIRKAGTPGANVGFGFIVPLILTRDYLSFFVNITSFLGLLLTPVKAEIFQLVNDRSGWRIHVSVPYCVVAMVIYFCWMVACIGITIHLHKNHTGLRWNPSTLAAQVALLQGSNILDYIGDIGNIRLGSLNSNLIQWYRNGTILRLGYWRKEGSDLDSDAIIHGVRFIAGPRNCQRNDESHLYQEAGGHGESDRPDIDRMWSWLLSDSFIIIMTLAGIAAVAAATFAWIKGYIYRPFQLPSVFSRRIFLASLVFSFSLNILVGLFHINFFNVDLYQRHLKPIQNMTKPLADDNQAGLEMKENNIKGAKAQGSMLMDYVSPNAVSCVIAAASAGHYKIMIGALLATLANSVQIIVSQIFIYTEGEIGDVALQAQPRAFYAVYFIIAFYCICIWILRPCGPSRTCRPPYTLMDFAMLVHKSYILKCPEFWSQGISDTEDHMKSQVLLADRVYQFGVYNGVDGGNHVGISIHDIPSYWATDDDSSQHDPRESGNSNYVEELRTSARLARALLKFSASDSTSFSFAQDFLSQGPPTWPNLQGGSPNKYRSWRRRARKIVGSRSMDE